MTQPAGFEQGDARASGVQTLNFTCTYDWNPLFFAVCSSVYRKGLSDLFLSFLLLFFITHFHSCRGYSHSYQVLLLLFFNSLPLLSLLCILLSSPPAIYCNLPPLVSLLCASLPSPPTALSCNSLLFLSLLYALLHSSTSAATAMLIASSVQVVLFCNLKRPIQHSTVSFHPLPVSVFFK